MSNPSHLLDASYWQGLAYALVTLSLPLGTLINAWSVTTIRVRPVAGRELNEEERQTGIIFSAICCTLTVCVLAVLGVAPKLHPVRNEDHASRVQYVHKAERPAIATLTVRKPFDSFPASRGLPEA